MSVRTNDEWLAALSSSSSEYEDAVVDLRQVLLNGLNRGLLGRVDTNAPEFATQAEDFVQEALLRILNKLDSFGGRSQFTTWAHKIAVNVALTELRRKRWQDSSLDQLTFRDGTEYTPIYTADKAPTPENLTERSDLIDRVFRLIEEGLTERQRYALTAIAVDGRTTVEVADVLEINPNAVYKLVHDARLRLKRLMADEGLSSEDVMAVFE